MHDFHKATVIQIQMQHRHCAVGMVVWVRCVKTKNVVQGFDKRTQDAHDGTAPYQRRQSIPFLTVPTFGMGQNVGRQQIDKTGIQCPWVGLFQHGRRRGAGSAVWVGVAGTCRHIHQSV